MNTESKLVHLYNLVNQAEEYVLWLMNQNWVHLIGYLDLNSRESHFLKMKVSKS
jgi:hypothetical protein